MENGALFQLEKWIIFSIMESPTDARCNSEVSDNSYIPWRIHGTIVYLPIHEWLIFMVNVGKYTIHGSYGYGHSSPKKVAAAVFFF